MANLLPSVVRVNPSYVDPGIILQINQASGAFDTLASGDLQVRLGEGDLYVYMRTMSVRTRVAAGQSAYNQLPSCSIVGSEISTPTYLLRNRAEYDHHDQAAGARWGVSVPQAQSLAMRQAHFQQARGGLLYGFNPQNGEGLVNTPGATAVNLPPDSNGNTTVLTYDNGQMAQFFLNQVLALKTRMYQMGQPARVVILGPQRTLGPMEYNVVQLTQFQRTGAGTDSTRGLIEAVLKDNKDSLMWVYDDTLIGKGAGGNDAVLIVIPEIDTPKAASAINTNEFGKLTPSDGDVTKMFCDMAAPREIPTPIAGGATDVLSEWRITSGWAIRPEGITLASMQYQ